MFDISRRKSCHNSDDHVATFALSIMISQDVKISPSPFMLARASAQNKPCLYSASHFNDFDDWRWPGIFGSVFFCTTKKWQPTKSTCARVHGVLSLPIPCFYNLCPPVLVVSIGHAANAHGVITGLTLCFLCGIAADELPSFLGNIDWGLAQRFNPAQINSATAHYISF